jgi:hypothetical protein
MDSITKSPNEKFPVYFNFSTDMITGETIATVTLTSVNQATGESSLDDRAYDPGPPEVLAIVKIIDSATNQTPDVKVVLKDGVEDEEHHVQCVVVTNNGNTYQRDLMVRIQSVVDDSFTKQPADAFLFDVDYTRRLESGDVIASAAVSAVKESDGSAASVFNTPSVISPKIGVPVYGGTSGYTYRFGVRGTTNMGYIYEKFIRMSVQEY